MLSFRIMNSITFYDSFKYLSSPIRWHESQTSMFRVSPHIVEFENTISSLCFCLFAIYGYYTYRRRITNNEIWALLMFIGLTSCWFHATMSHIGQFFDEVSIIAISGYCINSFTHKIVRDDDKLRKYRPYIRPTIIVASLGTVCVSWSFPAYSPFILILEGTCIMGPLMVVTTLFEPNILSRCNRTSPFISPIMCEPTILPRLNARQNVRTATFVAGLAVIFWVADFYCPFNAHFYWHFLISYAAYLFAIETIIILPYCPSIQNSIRDN